MGNTPVIDAVWREDLEYGVELALAHFVSKMGEDSLPTLHISDTPKRYTKALAEIFKGCYQTPEEALSTLFTSTFDQMIHVKDVEFFSMCAHHLLPFTGAVHFAYIPDTKIVGLSKIPRLIDVFACRPQIQEEMADQIVDSFQRIVNPKGCGVFIHATHFCCSARGIKKSCSMETTALRGCFKDASTKAEFLQAIR